MQKIEFGYSNDMDPSGSQEGLGIKPGLFLTDADYYGAIKFDGDQFVVVKVTEDEYNRYPQLLGKFMVIPAIADIYVDGSGIILLNQEQSEVAKQIEKILNEREFKDSITSATDIVKRFNGIYPADRTFDFLTDDRIYGDRILSTSILPDVFEMKQTALKRFHLSISQAAVNSYEHTYTRHS